MHLNVSGPAQECLAAAFAEVEARREELGIADVQIAMSTLEDVFLKIAKDSEVEEATRLNITTDVTLSSGEVVKVLTGSEEPGVSPTGITCSYCQISIDR